jgi:hypothetical protein
MHGKGDKYDAIKKEMPRRWLNTKTSNELLVITPMKLSSQCVKHMMDERNGKHRGVIQGNSPIICHHETLSYYFDITIRDDVPSVAIGHTNENFKKNELPTIVTNGDIYHNGSCSPIVVK